MSWNFKNEEEVKDYLKNLGIQYRFGCLQENKTDDYLETIDRNYDKAWKVYLNNCNSNYGRSCLKCGNYLVAGRGGQKPDKVKAIQYFEKSCELGEMDGCFRAGVLSAIVSRTKDAVKSFRQAVTFLEKGCEGNHNEACHHLSGVYMEGYEKEQIAKDMKRSFEYATKACGFNNMYACANLSMMYREGDGVEKNTELAEKFKLKAQEIQAEIIKQQQIKFQQGLNPV